MGISSSTPDPGRTDHKRKGEQKTDLGEIKNLAHILLMMDPEPNEKFPFIVKHPFTDSSFVDVELVDGSSPHRQHCGESGGVEKEEKDNDWNH